MALEEGYIFRCERCPKTMFVSKSDWEERHGDTCYGWETYKNKLLCPDCVQDLRKVMYKFWHNDIPSSRVEAEGQDG